MKRLMSAWALALAGLALASCVSSGKYKALEREHEELRARLDRTGSMTLDLALAKRELQESVKGLSSEKEALAKEKDSLSEDKAALIQQKQWLADEKAALEDLNASLFKARAEERAQYGSVLGKLKQEIQDGQLKLTQYKNMLSVDVAENAFFNSGSAQLKPEGRAVLVKLGGALNQYPDKYVRVLGHTDNVPVDKAPYQDNWDLATARAATVVRFLQGQAGVAGGRLEAAGRAQYDPVAGNDSPQGRQMNRRIEILLIDKALYQATQPSALAAPQPVSGSPKTAP